MTPRKLALVRTVKDARGRWGNVAQRSNGKFLARTPRPERTKQFDTEAQGWAWLATEEAKVRTTTAAPVVAPTVAVAPPPTAPADDPTVIDYARRVVAGWTHHGPGTARLVDQFLRHRLAPSELGAKRLSEVVKSDVQSWYSGLTRLDGKPLAKDTRDMQLVWLGAVFGTAVDDELRRKSPVFKIKRERVERKQIVPLTVDQVIAIADEISERCRAMVITQSGLGLRIGELLVLREQDVDFERQEVRIEKQAAMGHARGRVKLKTERSLRTVPLPTHVADALKEHMAKWPPLDDGSLFYNSVGRVFDRGGYIDRHFNPAVRRLVARGIVLPPRTRPHDLRHHYASVLLAGTETVPGESVITVAERIGDSPQMVTKTYGHMMPGHENRTRRLVDAVWGPRISK